MLHEFVPTALFLHKTRGKPMGKSQTLAERTENHRKTIELSGLPRYLANRDDNIIFKASNVHYVCPTKKKTLAISSARMQLTKALKFLIQNNYNVVDGYEISMYKTTTPSKYMSKRIK